MKNITNKLFIYAFLFLYAFVAFISFCHAIEFFDIGNVRWMSIMLAFSFELGLAVCLASILIGTNKRNNIAWLLLTILVIVQVIGNTYSVFKYISEYGQDYYNYLAKPMLFWIEEVSQETVQVIISWIMGAILPVVALLMTEMVANGIKEQQNDNEVKTDVVENEIKIDKVEDDNVSDDKEEDVVQEVKETFDDVHKDENIEENVEENVDYKIETLNEDQNIEENKLEEEDILEPDKEEKHIDIKEENKVIDPLADHQDKIFKKFF